MLILGLEDAVHLGNEVLQVEGLGQQFRLRAGATALQRYGMLLADNGSNWYLSGAPDPKWDNDDLRALKQLQGSDFEVVDTS